MSLQLLRNRCTTECRHIEMLASFQQEQCLVELLGVAFWVSDGESLPLPSGGIGS